MGLELNNIPSAYTGMLIRRLISMVFEAFIDPAVTTSFWFTKSSGRLIAGEKIKWEWAMYNVSINVEVKNIEKDRRISIIWINGEYPTEVEWLFTPMNDHTFVEITNKGFVGSGDDIISRVLDSLGGFSLVLAGAKAFLEHKLKLNLIADRFPYNIVTQTNEEKE